MNERAIGDSNYRDYEERKAYEQGQEIRRLHGEAATLWQKLRHWQEVAQRLTVHMTSILMRLPPEDIVAPDGAVYRFNDPDPMGRLRDVARIVREIREELTHQPKEFRVGDIVAPWGDTFLRSGCSAYPDAVVISLEPLMLASREADMLWSSTVARMQLVKVGEADPYVLAMCLRRLPAKPTEGAQG